MTDLQPVVSSCLPGIMRDDKAAAASTRVPAAADRPTSAEFKLPSEVVRFRLGAGSLLLIAAVGLLFFAKLVLHPSWVLYTDYSDLLTYQIPQMRYLVSSWQQTGEQPLWCPYSFAGMPFVHDLQVGAFYPPHLLLYYLPEATDRPRPELADRGPRDHRGMGHVRLCPKSGSEQNCAMVAALGYMFSGKWLLHLLAAGQYVAVGLAWLPLVLLLLERSMSRGGFHFATWAGAVLALVILGSHPQLTFYAGLLIACMDLAPGTRAGRCLRARSRTWRKIAVGLGRWVERWAGAALWRWL